VVIRFQSQTPVSFREAGSPLRDVYGGRGSDPGLPGARTVPIVPSAYGDFGIRAACGRSRFKAAGMCCTITTGTGNPREVGEHLREARSSHRWKCRWRRGNSLRRFRVLPDWVVQERGAPPPASSRIALDLSE